METNKLDIVKVKLVPDVPLYSNKSIDSPEAAIEILAEELSSYDREIFGILNLNIKNKPINFNIVSIGTLDQALVSPRDVFKTTILSNALSFIAIHNHPSGDATPSKDDIKTTKRLCECADILGIRMLDHIICGENKNIYSIGKEIGFKSIDDYVKFNSVREDISNYKNKKPIGRIEYLGFDGEPVEVIEYTNENKFVKDIKKNDYYGVATTVAIYEDENGKTIPLSFLKNIETSIKQLDIIKNPYLRTEDKTKKLENPYDLKYSVIANTGENYLVKSSDERILLASGWNVLSKSWDFSTDYGKGKEAMAIAMIDLVKISGYDRNFSTRVMERFNSQELFDGIMSIENMEYENLSDNQKDAAYEKYMEENFYNGIIDKHFTEEFKKIKSHGQSFENSVEKNIESLIDKMENDNMGFTNSREDELEYER
ncbi:MAG: JAB domain-containing protein [Peptostreptococcaceae bacterium]|nr:JAB domain-containing protein [Peptostreptococcaceae bacterium]MDY5739240.1 JAB domain-containing protein [Anaerovoracaceae bacterium]